MIKTNCFPSAWVSKKVPLIPDHLANFNPAGKDQALVQAYNIAGRLLPNNATDGEIFGNIVKDNILWVGVLTVTATLYHYDEGTNDIIAAPKVVCNFHKYYSSSLTCL